ncbi:restriction endonuclease subunit S [Flavobacterium frigidarium]|uniref:Restriction endonuclease subunit S n=1 Tax=Flavobacterium frigidarium TaxID=99286 RepID=A0ABV4KCI3_9FLAO
MQSNYKKLGDYIQPVNNRNKELIDVLLLGVSIKKVLMPSIANIIGTDMSTYKLISKNQFAYGPVTSRNGDKISIALLEDHENAMISQAYTVFEVVNENELLPEYLMMWFRRPEFDRYARFKSHGSAREIFDWAEMCETELPIPSLEKQQEIVKEYNVIQNRITLNNQLITKLEETAQAIYKQWFVDFEFLDGNGKPYKSNGGEMVFCEELEKDIPVGWRIDTFENMMDFKTGKLNSNAAVVDGEYPFFTCSSETYKTNTCSFDCEAVLLAGNNASAIYPLKYFNGKFDAYQRTYIITPKNKMISIYQIYFAIKDELEGFKGVSSGTATKFLTMKILNPIEIFVCDSNTNLLFSKYLKPFFIRKLEIEKNQELFYELSSITQAKMTKVETEIIQQ